MLCLVYEGQMDTRQSNLVKNPVGILPDGFKPAKKIQFDVFYPSHLGITLTEATHVVQPDGFAAFITQLSAKGKEGFFRRQDPCFLR